MCIHCCRLRHMPCPPIPYACPHCPVREIASACFVHGRKQARKPDNEHKWYMARMRDRYKFPCVCHSLPPRWLDVNRSVIFELARRLDHSPEAIHYLLLRLLHANYGRVMRIMKRRRSYEIPLASQALFFAPSSLIDEHGNLTAPMHPESVERLLRLIQDYLHRMQLLNRKYKWFNNGLDKGDLVGLLGEQDELLKLLCSVLSICDDQNLLSMQRLLQVLNGLDMDKLFQGGKARGSSISFRGISDLYSKVAAESPNKERLKKELSNQQPSLEDESALEQETPIQDRSGDKSPSMASSKLTESTVSSQSAVSMAKVQKREPSKKYIYGESPMAFHEPFNADKPWTWLSRMPQRKRLMQDGTFGEAPVRRYRTMEERARLARMRDNMSIHSERSLMEGTEFRSTFGGRRPSTASRISNMRRSQDS